MKKKETKSLKILKKGFKKNEVVIYAIALMLVTAGYFNYTANIENSVLETASEDVKNTSGNTNAINNIENTTTNNENTTGIATNTENKEEKNETNNTSDEEIGDAKLVNSNSVEEDYFATTKLTRDTNYADMISTYTKIIEDSSVPETQKAIAMKEITKINDKKNSISICENLLSTKGFKDYVVLLNNESVNVIVKVEGKLEKQQVAQIQNIVSRELNSKIENIHITEK